MIVESKQSVWKSAISEDVEEGEVKLYSLNDEKHAKDHKRRE